MSERSLTAEKLVAALESLAARERTFILPDEDGDPTRLAVYADDTLVDVAEEDLTSPGGLPLVGGNNAVTRVCMARHRAAWLRDVLIALELGPAPAPVKEG